MKKKSNKDFSGIVVCDSITMSVKKKKKNYRKAESVIIAIIGFISVIMSFLEMFDFNYNCYSIIKAAIIFSIIYILISLAGKKSIWISAISVIIMVCTVYKYIKPIIKGFKFTYNVIYSESTKSTINYYKFLDYNREKYCTTIFFIFCIWLLAFVIYFFTIYRPNFFITFIFSFPIIEIGLYNGIDIPIFWGMLTIAYWIALLAICCIDLGEYSGGSGGFVRKENFFFPKRHMKFKVTEKCAMQIIISVALTTATTLAVIKLAGYQRSDELNQKRIDIKEAVNAFSLDDAASSISAITESFGFTLSYETNKLGTHDHLKYRNVTDIIVTVNEKYESAIYLKGYAGAIYKNNEWTGLSDKAYSNAKSLFNEFENYSIYPQDFPYIFNQSVFSDTPNMTIWIDTKRKKNKSYAPYATDDYGDLKYNNDTSVSSKNNNSSKYSYKFCGINETNGILFDSGTESRFSLDDISDESWHEKVRTYCTEHDLLDEYNQNYFNGFDCNRATNMKNNGQLIMTALLEKEYNDFVYDNYLQVPDTEEMDEIYTAFSDILKSSDKTETNTQKLQLLTQIKDRINSMTEYSLNPGKTPSNRDFINYFLLENHKGYCTHYASAGVILSRMAGIPARYATGYIVVGDDFNNDTLNNDGSYTINVQDNRSHAWTEIYLDGFGWVPFEFTAGYSNMAINTETTTSVSTTSLSQTETVTVSNNTQTNTSRSTQQQSASKDTDVTSTITVTTENNSGNNTSLVTHSPKTLSKILTVLSIILFIALLIYLRRLIILKRRNKRFRQGKIQQRIIYIYEYTEKLLRFIKFNRGNLQYTEFSEYIENTLGGLYFENGQFRKLIEIALKSNFDNKNPDEKCTAFAIEFSEKFSKNIFKKQNLIGKIKMLIIKVLI